MLAQRNNTAKTTTPRLMVAKFRGVCSCGIGFLAGEPIEFDPATRQKRCRRCIQNPSALQQNNVIDFDSYRGLVMRLKQIAELPRPLAPRVVDEYWTLMNEISTAPETSKSVKEYLETAACCPKNHSKKFLVTLTEDKQCVHCFEIQKRGELVLMDFTRTSAHCIWCECTKL